MIALDGFVAIQSLGDTGFRLGINRRRKERKRKERGVNPRTPA
jgi:hypothetical protein